MASALVGWHLKVRLSGELFTFSRNCLTLEGPSLQGQQNPGCQSIRKRK